MKKNEHIYAANHALCDIWNAISIFEEEQTLTRTTFKSDSCAYALEKDTI